MVIKRQILTLPVSIFDYELLFPLKVDMKRQVWFREDLPSLARQVYLLIVGAVGHGWS